MPDDFTPPINVSNADALRSELKALRKCNIDLIIQVRQLSRELEEERITCSRYRLKLEQERMRLELVDARYSDFVVRV